MNASEPVPKGRRVAARVLDGFAVLLIALAIWRFFLAPLVFTPKASVAPVPPMKLSLMNGGVFDTAGARGQVVFLDFWASWCAPCKLSIPLIERYKATHPSALVFSIDSGEPQSVAERYARNAKMRRVAFDPDMKLTDALGVRVFPTMIVIGRDGKEHAKWIGFNPLIQQDMARAAAKY